MKDGPVAGASDRPPQPEASSHSRYPGLDTLRAFAILVVIPWHAMGVIHNPPLREFGRYGWAGVDLFFVLSGFLIGSQILQTMKREGRINFPRFYLKRSLRILPSYWVVLLLYVIWPDFHETAKFAPPWRFLLFIANLPMIGRAFSHAWSLCVEEHFYLLFPVAVWWYGRRPRKLHPGLLISGLFVAGMILRYWIWSAYSVDGTQKWDFWQLVYYPSYCRVDGLAVGVGLGLLREYRSRAWQRLTSWPWVLTVAGVGLVAAGLAAFDGDKEMAASVFSFPLVSLGFGALVAAAMVPRFWLAEKRVPGTAVIATAAYTVYLTHKQMIRIAVRLIDQPETHPVLTVALAVTLIVVASSLLHFAVERPGLLLRDRILRGKQRALKQRLLDSPEPALQ